MRSLQTACSNSGRVHFVAATGCGAVVSSVSSTPVGKSAHAVKFETEDSSCCLTSFFAKIQLIHYIIRNLTSYQHDLITQTKTANNISSKNFIKGKPLKIDITFQKQQVMKNQSQRVHMRLHQQLCIWFKRPSFITYREVQNGLHLRSFSFLSCCNENKIKVSK